ncbi:MAG: sigma-54-dependent Fis family transcriptional regulator [Deltaproteobacteria bacterium]|nr:MAG: sigma-54-dependent Fis family transcriptional regulator [Deltaproteobacteria bacterium]
MADSGDALSAAETRTAGRRRSDRIVGASRATERALDQAAAAARSELPVVVTGPSGSGRRFIARAIHSWSARSAGPLVTLSCVAVNSALQAREIFGTSAGAHAPAPAEHIGALTRAAGGTLHLTDIEGLAPEARVALRSALVDGSFRREGDGTEQPLRARLIGSAEEWPEAGPFAQLPCHEVRLAPLSERPEDVLPLAAHFLALFASELGVQATGFTAEARDALLAESWQGNVRELRERIRQAVQLSGGGAVTHEALALAAEDGEPPSFKDAKRAFETRYVEGMLRRCGGNISRAARLAKKDRKDFYDVIRRTGVDPSRFR